MKKVFIYVRVSSQEQAKEGYSIGEQTARLKAYCEAHKWLILNVYTDGGYSGGNTNRPALQSLINDVKKGFGDAVLVYKLDRLSRSQKDTLELIEDCFLAHGVDFISMSENFDTSTPFGKAMVGILAVFAQLEREQIRERMAMGIDARLKEGKWTGAVPPYGYDYADGMLTVNAYEAMRVKEMFDMFCTGHQLANLSKTFTDRYKSNSAKYEWSVSKLRYMLSNRVYVGMVRTLSGDWIKGVHDPIVSDDVFEKAQAILAERKRKYAESGIKAGSSNVSTYLGGMIICKHCGAKYGKYRSGNANKFHYNYGCYSKTKKVKHMIIDPTCNNKTYHVDELDSMVFGEIRKLAVDPSYIRSIKTDDSKDRENVIMAEIAKVDAQISRLMDLYAIGKFDLSQLDAKVSALNEQKNRLTAEAEQLHTSRMDEAEAMNMIMSFGDVLDSGDFRQTRAMLEMLIDFIEIDNDNVIIHWNFV